MEDLLQHTRRAPINHDLATFIDRCQRCVAPHTEGDQFRARFQEALALVPSLSGYLQRLVAEATLWRLLLHRSTEEGRRVSVSFRTCRLLETGSIDEAFRELVNDWTSVPVAQAPAAADRRIANARQYVDEHLSEPNILMETVAQHVNLSKWHFQHLLKRVTGYGFRRFVAAARLERARLLLLTTVLQVKEVAARVGYKHANEMTRQFRQLQNTTPQAIRRGADQFLPIERRSSGIPDRRKHEQRVRRSS